MITLNGHGDLRESRKLPFYSLFYVLGHAGRRKREDQDDVTFIPIPLQGFASTPHSVCNEHLSRLQRPHFAHFFTTGARLISS